MNAHLTFPGFGQLFEHLPDADDLFVVDLFAGGGGASEGIRRALGRCPDVAVNHDPAAIEMHEANHPSTRHYCESVFAVDPVEACRGRRPDLLWASPDCTHHSRAKGGKPRDNARRGLAWVVVDWAERVRPRVICLENVPEFEEWGPLDEEGQPRTDRKGETFRQFVGRLESVGYRVEWRTLRADHYGTPTIRKRLFLVAHCDGLPVVWPAASHGAGLLPVRTAAGCIDWSIPCPTIFGRKRPLAEKTLARIADGIRRYVLESPSPFIVTNTSGNPPAPISSPLKTVTTGNHHYLVDPVIVQTGHQSSGMGSKVRPAGVPLSTVVTKAEHLLVAPTLAHMGNSEREGQRPRSLDPRAPLPTVTAKGSNQALVSAFLAKHYSGVVGQGLDAPAGTVTTRDHHALVSAHLTTFYGTSTGRALDQPAPTVTAQAYGGHAGLVAAFLAKFYGTGGQHSDAGDPMHTVTTKHRMALVTVQVDGETYVLVDIGMRMLQPRELARAQGFDDSYILTGTKTEQVARIGNSVPPPVVEAIVRANVPCRGVVAA